MAELPTSIINSGGSVGTAGDGSMNRLFGNLFRSTEALMALGVIVILTMLIVPLPTWLLDLMLVISISFSVMILMTVMFIGKPLEFSSFPTVLLVATLLRLALNLSSTRLILAHGHEGSNAAGHVIEAFAGFVMSGNFVIGVIVFAILTIVNFVVVTKGSGRIAEVAARFTLDAMPGKQMAIDADLSSGLIEEGAARARRKELEAESNFHGSMDGAAKFVRGDAVAGLIITFINIVAGIIIGVAQKDMSFMQAADNYIRLTVGDGLVTQVPALIVSVGAGLLVTKAIDSGGGDSKGGSSLFDQMGRYPYALFMTSGLMTVFAFMPGMPFVPFAVMAGGAGYMGYTIYNRRELASADVARADALAAIAPPVADEPISKSLTIEDIKVELGYGLVTLVSTEAGVRLTEQIKAMRRQLAMQLGFIVPQVNIKDNLSLPPNTYRMSIKEIEVGRGELRPNMLLVMDARGEVTLPGEKTVEPAFGMPAMWVDQTYREEAMFKGYIVTEPSTVITTHLTELIKDHLPDLLSYTETQKLLDELPKEQQKLVADIIPSRITVSFLQNILKNLLRERVSVRDLPAILEGIAEAGSTPSIGMATEMVRGRLSRQICDSYTIDGFLPLVTLSPDWEQRFMQAMAGDGEMKQLALPPTDFQQFVNSVRTTFERFSQMGESPVLLTSPVLRPYVRSIMERFRGETAVLSINELHAKTRIKTLGQL